MGKYDTQHLFAPPAEGDAGNAMEDLDEKGFVRHPLGEEATDHSGKDRQQGGSQVGRNTFYRGASLSGPQPAWGTKGVYGIGGTEVSDAEKNFHPKDPHDQVRHERPPTPEELMAMADAMEQEQLQQHGRRMAQGPAARRLASGSASTGYDTELTSGAERAFQGSRDGDTGVDYDLRGAFAAGQGRGGNGHMTDQFKKPNHPTFSNESQYAEGENAKYAGHWGPGEENYIPGQERYSDTIQERQLGGSQMPPDWLSQYMDAQQAGEPENVYTGPTGPAMGMSFDGMNDKVGARKYRSEQERLKELRNEERHAGRR